MKIKNLVEESINEKLINIKILIDRIEEHEKSCS